MAISAQQYRTRTRRENGISTVIYFPALDETWEYVYTPWPNKTGGENVREQWYFLGDEDEFNPSERDWVTSSRRFDNIPPLQF